jgi:hypothetical protein
MLKRIVRTLLIRVLGTDLVEYVSHVYARTEGIAGVLISDKDYPIRVAYSLLTKILDEFLQRYPLSKINSSSSLDFPELHGVRLPRKDKH